jgi:hypothetical protein
MANTTSVTHTSTESATVTLADIEIPRYYKSPPFRRFGPDICFGATQLHKPERRAAPLLRPPRQNFVLPSDKKSSKRTRVVSST